jgi:ubiquinone/menaquinone biosynthesis C-methylase UbiE
MQDHQEIRESVRRAYAKIAAEGPPQAGCCAPSCCAPADGKSSEPQEDRSAEIAAQLGYSAAEIDEVPDGANLGLGCGNPQAIAELRPGEAVLDLGSGGGFDCFLAAKAVGEKGSVIGVDMTSEMVARARKNADSMGVGNVDFRLGEIERLPVADGSVDVILSNCVINLSPDKPSVFKEAFRVLTSGGRLAISDVVATAPLTDDLKANLELLTGCVSGAAQISDLESMLTAAGFEQIRVKEKPGSRKFIREWFPAQPEIADAISSATIEAVKP